MDILWRANFFFSLLLNLSGISKTFVTDDEGLSPSWCSWLSGGLSDSAARELAQCHQGVEYGPAWKSQWFSGLCSWGPDALVDGGDFAVKK